MSSTAITNRPYGGKHPVQVRLSEEDLLALKARAEAECRSLASMASLLLREAMNAQPGAATKHRSATAA